jgi:hypothetical protein
MGMERDDVADRLRGALPDLESVLIAVLCLGVLSILLDSLGIDVVENLRESVSGDEPGYLVYLLAMALLWSLIERVRDAFDGSHTADVPDPLGDREVETENVDETAPDEPVAEERVGSASSRNESVE